MGPKVNIYDAMLMSVTNTTVVFGRYAELFPRSPFSCKCTHWLIMSSSLLYFLTCNLLALNCLKEAPKLYYKQLSKSAQAT